jgi:hypothetical protein
LEKLRGMLLALGGSRVRVYQDTHSGSVAISFLEILPKLLAPLLVLDANADKREAYRLWDRARGGLEHLFSPTKTYSNLTIHPCDLRAGKEAHRQKKHRDPLVEVAVVAFFEAMKMGAERVLFLHNKPQKPHQDMERLIRTAIKKRGGHPDLGSFLTWGLHKATNKFGDIKHVVAIGVQQAPLYEITAMARGVARVPPHKPISSKTVGEVRETEILHTLFQGVGRSAVRKTIDGDVPEGCHLWLIASTRGHMPFPLTRLAEWFPEASVVDWTPIRIPLKPSEAAIVEAVEVCLESGTEGTVSVQVLSDGAGVSWNTVLRRLRLGIVQKELERRGIAVAGPDLQSPKGSLALTRLRATSTSPTLLLENLKRWESSLINIPQDP